VSNAAKLNQPDGLRWLVVEVETGCFDGYYLRSTAEQMRRYWNEARAAYRHHLRRVHSAHLPREVEAHRWLPAVHVRESHPRFVARWQAEYQKRRRAA
jgi:hypothetical protein